MNNTINNVNSLSFNSRYLKIKNQEQIPQQIRDAIYKSNGIDEFLKAGEPKTLLEKIINLFKKDEILEVSYLETIVGLPKMNASIPKDKLRDPFTKACNIIFTFFGKKGSKISTLYAEQQGIRRQAGSVPKIGEHHTYKEPIEKAEDTLAKKIEEITDLCSILK